MQKLPKELKGPFVAGQYDKSLARLYLKRPNGNSQIVEDVFPALFVARQQIDNFPFDAFPEVFVDHIDEGIYHRVTMRPGTKRAKIDEVLDVCREERVYPREADVDPVRRWFSDTGALVSSETKALFFDLETNPLIPGFDDEAKKQHCLLSYAAEDLDGNRWFDVNASNDEAGEERLLRSFLDLAKNYDTLLAWNGNDYDFFVLRARARELKVDVNWFDWNLLDYMLTVKKCLMSISDPTFKRSFALDNIGYNVLGIQKLKPSVPMGKLHRLLDGRVEELKAYNERDVEIMTKLEHSREFLQLHLAVCSICRMFPSFHSLYPNALADGLMLRLAVREDRHFKSRYKAIDEDDEDKFKGAYVMDAKLGFHKDVQVIDFSSLYPSIIISWNMSPDTKIWENTRYHGPKATATATNVEFRTDREGMLPMALRTLLERRKLYAGKQKKAEVGTDEWKRFGHESTALKVVANSMYGLLGSRYSRYYDRDIAQSVTLTGQLLIKESIKFCEERGYRVIAGDTDSCFVCASEEDVADLVDGINDDLIPRITRDSGCYTNIVRMDSDKGYHYLLIQAKKKYAGRLSLHKGRPAPDDMEPDVKGLEFQRSDQIKYAQKMQMEFIHMLLDPNAVPSKIQEELKKRCDSFMTDDIPREQIEITQSISKHPTKYEHPTPAVRVATQMIKDGKEFFIGIKVPYIVVNSQRTGGDLKVVKAIHADDYKGKFDRKFYWVKKILPPVERLVRVRFPDIRLDILDYIRKDPDQFIFDYQQEPKVKKVKVKIPKPKRKVKKVKAVKTTLSFKEEHKVDTVRGLFKLINSSDKGNHRIWLRIELDDGQIADISTEHRVDNKCLRKIKELFPWVQIDPPSI